ncbi:hypothetical protein D3C85_900020 [compost metagenome]
MTTLTLDQELRVALAAAELFDAGRLMGNSRPAAIRTVIRKARAWTRKRFPLEEFPTLRRLQLHRLTA